MAQSTLWLENKAILQALLSKVNHAVIYMDNAMAELLHWSGGIGPLLDAGADDVREFSSFESGSESQKKAVFVVSTPLQGVTKLILQDVVSQSQFQYVVVMTTVSPLLHIDTGAPEADSEAVFEEFEEEIQQWMGNMNYTAEVLHLPLFGVVVCEELILAPTFSSLYPLAASDVRQIAHQFSTRNHGKENKTPQDLADLEFLHLPPTLQQNLKMFASGLHALLQVLDVREDIYSVGHTSRLIATELDSYSPARSRRKTCQNRASIVLLDRTLDSASAMTHQQDTLMDRLMNTLSRLEGHATDSQVDMSRVCHVNRNCSNVIFPGSLATSSSSALPPSHLSALIHKRQKEAVMDINRKLVETAAAEKLPLNLSARPGRVTADQINSTLELFCGKYNLIGKHLDTLQVAAATSQVMRQTAAGAIGTDSLVALEKNIVQTVAEAEGSEGPSGLAVLYRAVVMDGEKPQPDRQLSLDDILRLLTFTFSVCDGECGDEEEAVQMREKIVELIKRDRDDLPPITKEIVGDVVAENILHDVVESLWEKLESVGSERDNMQQFRSVLDQGDVMTPACVRPLLRRVVEAVVDPGKPDLLDVECKSGGLGNLLKSGFGFFKASAKPRPGDAPLLILFVIGGVTAGEVKQVREVMEKAKPGFEILIGSTRLASQEYSLQSIFVHDNVNIELT